MKREEEIINSLCGKFPFLAERIYFNKDKRIFTKPLSAEEFEQIIPYVHDELGFYRACHVVGTDDGDSFGLLYVLADSEDILLMLRESAPRSIPVVKSVSKMYASITLHERELVDLFGVIVEGLPEGNRYPLPDGWPDGNFPLRKDWDPKSFNKTTMTYDKPQETEAQKNG